MTRNHLTDSGIEPENAPLRSELRTRADLVTIIPPPIPLVRRNARKRRMRRRVVRGLSGMAVTCAVVAGVIVFSPGQDTGISPAPTNTDRPSPTRTAGSPSPTPNPTPSTKSTSANTSTNTPPTSTSSSTSSLSTSASSYLLASDLGAGWTGPDGSSAPRTELIVAGSDCQNAGVYQPQVPVTPAPNKIYRNPDTGPQPNVALEAVYLFAPGTGPAVMTKVRAALKTGCGQPGTIKLLTSPPTAADETIVYTSDGNTRNILVRSGDRVASILLSTIPAGQEGTTWITEVAQRMATRLMAG